MADFHSDSFVLGFLAGIIAFYLLYFIIFILRPWFRAVLNGAQVPLYMIVAMRLRGSPPLLLVDAYIAILKSGGQVSIEAVEATFLMHKERCSTHEELVQATRSAMELAKELEGNPD